MKALYEATSVENAVELRLEHPEAQIIAGGSDVLVQMREGKRAGKELISIYGLDELRGIEALFDVAREVVERGVVSLIEPTTKTLLTRCEVSHRGYTAPIKADFGGHFEEFVTRYHSSFFFPKLQQILRNKQKFRPSIAIFAPNGGFSPL